MGSEPALSGSEPALSGSGIINSFRQIFIEYLPLRNTLCIIEHVFFTLLMMGRPGGEAECRTHDKFGYRRDTNPIKTDLTPMTSNQYIF